jgi:hypothetical protein
MHLDYSINVGEDLLLVEDSCIERCAPIGWMKHCCCKTCAPIININDVKMQVKS